MDAKTFFFLVRNMRIAQKNYFKTRAPQFLNDSKILEQRVDDEIDRVEQILNPKPQWKEGDIF